MGRFEVQGIVSSESNLPMVQLRQLDDDDNEIAGFQVDIMEAREIAQTIQEAATNAVCDAALITWAISRGNLGMGVMLVDTVRKHRADKFGFPDRPEDWRNKNDDSPAEEPTV